MPIAGLSDRESVDPRFKEIGRIRKGGEKKGNQPGADLDYFRFVPNHRDPEVVRKLEALFYRLYGNTPDTLRVYLPFETMERNFTSWREKYGANRLCQLRCDGARWHDWIEGDRHRHSDIGVECTFDVRDTENRCPDCELGYYGRLSIILPDMWEADPRAIGLVTVMTTSINDIAYLSSKLVAHEPLVNKPFVLWREPERIGVPIKGRRAAKDSNLLHLELDEERQRLEFLAGTRQAVALLEREAGIVDGEYTIEDDPPEEDLVREVYRVGMPDPPESYPEEDVDPGTAPSEKAETPGKDPSELIEQGRAKMKEEAAEEIDELPNILVPPPEGDWTEFYRRCEVDLHLSSTEASKLKDRFWLSDRKPTKEEWNKLWNQMVEYQAEEGVL